MDVRAGRSPRVTYGLCVKVKDEASVVVFFSFRSFERISFELHWLDSERLSVHGSKAKNSNQTQQRHVCNHSAKNGCRLKARLGDDRRWSDRWCEDLVWRTNEQLGPPVGPPEDLGSRSRTTRHFRRSCESRSRADAVF